MNHPPAKLISASLCLFVFSSLVVLRIEAKGKNITIDKNDQTTTVECTGNAVTVSGQDNNITLKGECSKLTVKGKDNNITAATIKEVVVSGTDNNVTVAIVARINVTGEDNNILWGNGMDGKAPKISKKGNDVNIVHTGR